jgi:hypothetical protein
MNLKLNKKWYKRPKKSLILTINYKFKQIKRKNKKTING